MCKLSSTMVIKYYSQYGGGGPMKYNKIELEKIDEAIAEVMEDWVDTVFGADSKLESEAWMKEISKHANNWLFDPEKLRKACISKAGLDYRC